MPYYAHVVNELTEDDTARPFDSAEAAARNLAMLLRRFGYEVGTEGSVSRLILGETLRHRNKSYRVTDKP
jgi:hypothetical protein